MMALLLKYVQDTGEVVGVWESTSLAVLQAQRVEEAPGQAVLLYLGTVAASVLEQAYVVQDGEVVARPVTREDV
jgi:hypothetical protein